ncbi:MAG: 5'-nucleotidase C-terminal domain-containing protein, partial [Bifidobacteriaceae bacterium]|nr:5'-nucleotidase C-terminal domain-containing protein [Bifidobacteriaceae bacterium]
IIGVINPGGIRANITPKADGTITYGDVATTTPFANEMYIATVTGAKLRLALEQQWQAQVDNENTECPTYIADGNACYKTPTRARLKLGISENVTYTYDEDLVIDPLGNTVCRWQKTYQGGDSKTVVAAEQCTHIVDIFVDGKKIADNDTFTLVSNKFLLPDGGDNFFAFKDANESSDSDGVYNVVNTGKNDLEALVDYFKAHPVITTPDVGRSINTRYNIKDMLQIDFGTSNPFVATEGVHFTVKGSNALLKNRTITVNAHSETTNIDQFLTLGETSVNNEYEVPALPAGNHNITVGLSGIGQVNFPITVPDNNGPLSETGISILAGLIVVVALLLVVASINLKKKKEANLNTVATDENKE